MVWLISKTLERKCYDAYLQKILTLKVNYPFCNEEKTKIGCHHYTRLKVNKSELIQFGNILIICQCRSFHRSFSPCFPSPFHFVPSFYSFTVLASLSHIYLMKKSYINHDWWVARILQYDLFSVQVCLEQITIPVPIPARTPLTTHQCNFRFKICGIINRSKWVW